MIASRDIASGRMLPDSSLRAEASNQGSLLDRRRALLYPRGIPHINEQSLDPAAVPGPKTTLADLVSYPEGRALTRLDDTFLGRRFALRYWLDNIALSPRDRLEALVNGQWLRVRYVHDRHARMEEVTPRKERAIGQREPIVIPLPTDSLFRWPRAEYERLRRAYARDEAKNAKKRSVGRPGSPVKRRTPPRPNAPR